MNREEFAMTHGEHIAVGKVPAERAKRWDTRRGWWDSLPCRLRRHPETMKTGIGEDGVGWVVEFGSPTSKEVGHPNLRCVARSGKAFCAGYFSWQARWWHTPEAQHATTRLRAPLPALYFHPPLARTWYSL
jgi:hypothetical protein